MTVDKPLHLVPKLRFPEFEDALHWDTRPLIQLAHVIAGQSPSGENYNTTGNGVPFYQGKTDFGDTYLNKPTKWTTQVTKLAQPNDILMSVRAPVGALNVSTEQICIGRGLASLRSRCDKWFLYYALLGQQGRIMGNGGSVFDSITKKQIEDLLILVPPTTGEQKKIAHCLGALDDLIAAQGRKLVALREHKRGLLRNVLPQDGNVQPAVRFSQYRDAEAWNVIRLGDIADYENGKAYEKDIVDNGRFVVANARFISTDGVVRKYTNETYCIAQTSDVLMVLSDLPSAKALARCFFVDADDTYAVNQRVAKLRPRSVDSRFLLYALDQHPWLMAFSDGINQTHLSKGSVLDCPLAVPRDDGEQKLIGECLGAIDSRVATQEAKLAALTRHKTGLLQQLFPSPEEESR